MKTRGLTTNSKTVVYTAIFCDYDVLPKPQKVPEYLDFVYFTDDPEIATGKWEPVVIQGLAPAREQTA
jgi:hypothetical protein